MANSVVKKCLNCKTEKPVSEFYVMRRKGHVNYQGHCKECSKRFGAASTAAKREREKQAQEMGN